MLRNKLWLWSSSKCSNIWPQNIIEWLGKSAGRKHCKTWKLVQYFTRNNFTIQKKLTIVVIYKEYDQHFYEQREVWQSKLQDPILWRLITKLLPCGYFSFRHYLTLSPNWQEAGTLNVLQHNSTWLNALTV